MSMYPKLCDVELQLTWMSVSKDLNDFLNRVYKRMTHMTGAISIVNTHWARIQLMSGSFWKLLTL